MTDREKLIDLIINAKRTDPETGSFTEYLADFLLGYGVKLPDDRPVSREQVILCKDCQYWQGNNGGYPHPECRWGNDETPDEDDYCSFAERLEVSKNG